MTINDIRSRLAKRTQGTWVYGDYDHIQGSEMCQCRPQYGPLIWAGPMNINGTVMPTHVHRAYTKRTYSNGITSQTETGSKQVVTETTEYGTMSKEDADFIAHAPQDIEFLLKELDRLGGDECFS